MAAGSNLAIVGGMQRGPRMMAGVTERDNGDQGADALGSVDAAIVS